MSGRRLCLMVTSSITAITFLDGYLRFLRDDGWEVTLVCAPGPGVAAMVDRAGTAFVALPMEREPSPLKDLRALFSAYRLLRRLRPDVLVYATPKAGLLGAMAGRAAGVPRRVYEFWGLRLETASGWRRRIFAALESTTMRWSTVVIANSRSLAARATELGLNGGREVVVLGEGSSHGVDAVKFSRMAPMPSLDPAVEAELGGGSLPVVGFVGRMHPDKGIDTLFAALLLCAERGTRFALLIVGPDEGADVGGLATRLRAIAPVCVAGHVEDPRPMLGRMDMLVLPSLREGFPNVVLEAAAMEVPAVVSDATGCIDSVIDGETGAIVPVGDADALADAIVGLLANPDRRSAMGSAARRRVQEEFVPEDVWRRHAQRWRV